MTSDNAASAIDEAKGELQYGGQGDLAFRSALWSTGCRPKRPLLPWEDDNNAVHRILGKPEPFKFPKVRFWPENFMTMPSSSSGSQAPQPASDADLVQVPVLKQVHKSWIRKTALCKAWHDAKNEARTSALQSWKALILGSGRATVLGALIMDDLASSSTPEAEAEAQVFQSVRDAFAGKSVSTLRSRANSLLCYARFAATLSLQDIEPVFPMSENSAYAYVCHLRREGAPKSRMSRFIQAVGFAKGLVGASVDEVLQSPRIKGACQNTEPAPVRKKSPLKVEEVVFLERLASDPMGGPSGIIAGFVCFLLHCRLRWSDGMCVLQEPRLDINDGRGFLEAELYSHKTIAAMQFRLLPVVGVLPGLSGMIWAEGWLQNRLRQGLHASRNLPLQPAPMAWGSWAKTPFEACSGALWLRETLSKFRSSPESRLDVATHSLKCTVLSWLSRAACPGDLQRRAGYHLAVGERNPAEYERDGQSAVLHFIQGVYLCIQGSLFFPDSERSARWSGCRTIDEGVRVLVHGRAESVLPRTVEADGDSDHGAESDEAGGEGDLVSEGDRNEAEAQVARIGESLSGVVTEDSRIAFRHRVSSVVHLARDDAPPDEGEITVFRCGRLANHNYERLSFVPVCDTRQCATCWM